jgi:hypothetical protein
MAVGIVLSSGILAWFVLYGDFSHHSPVRAKQVFQSITNEPIPLRKNEKTQYNMAYNEQTISGSKSFNQGGNEYGCKGH